VTEKSYVSQVNEPLKIVDLPIEIVDLPIDKYGKSPFVMGK
jgi:hypothetical protein